MFHVGKYLIVFYAASLISIPVAAQEQVNNSSVNIPPEVGYWATKKNDGIFYIYQCDQKLCGRFVGMKYTGAEPPKTSRGNSQCNFEMLRGLVKEQNSKKWIGKIADPRDEQLYNAKIWISKPDQLSLRGYMGISLFGETHVWHRFYGKVEKDCRLLY